MNKNPINLRAKFLLQQVKQTPDPSMLYLLQLAMWALATGEVKVDWVQNKNAAGELRDLLDQMLGMNPEKIMDLLTKQGPDEWTPWITLPEMTQLRTAAETAQYLMERMASALEM